MSTDTADFDFTRNFTISPAELWHLLTDAEMRAQWSGPDMQTVMTTVVADTSEGGIERHRSGPEDAPEFEAETRWYRLAAPEDAVFTETIEAGGARIATSLVTYRITENDAGSALEVHVHVSSFCGPEAPAEFKAGWSTALDSLALLAKKRA